MNFVGIVERSDWQIESWSTRGSADECAGDFGGWHDDIHQLIGSSRSLFKGALMVRKPMKCWTIGRVTLLGDACHPTLPMLAQGAVMAIEDRFISPAAAKAGPTPPKPRSHGMNGRAPSARNIVLGCRQRSAFTNPALADPLRAKEYLNREWSHAAITRRYEWLFIYDVAGAEI